MKYAIVVIVDGGQDLNEVGLIAAAKRRLRPLRRGEIGGGIYAGGLAEAVGFLETVKP